MSVALTPSLASRDRRRRWLRVRVGVLGFLVLCGAGAVVRRAFELQIERAPALREMAEEQYLRSVRLAPKRGTVFDRHGAELAVSVDVDSVWASPSELRRENGDPNAVATQLAALLGVDRERIATRLASDRHFVWIKRHITPELAQRVSDAELPGVHLDREARRFYPNRELAAHVLGFANIDGEGIEGLELSLEEQLRGSRHTVPAVRDRRGRVVYSDSLLDDSVGQGADVTLTIDRTIQRVAERELALAVQTYEAKAGSVVVMDPRTGEILAIADYPTFDPNAPGRYPASHRRNRAVTDRFEPGSTVKPFTVAAALSSGTIRPEQSIDCEGGAMQVDEYVIHDTTPHEQLTPAQILAYSSNIGTAKIGGSLGREGLYRAFRAFGFGETTGLPLPGEVSGSLRHFRRWYEMDAATISFGQGVSVTSVQLASAMGALANGGVLVKPTLVRRITSARGEVLEEHRPEARRRVVSERTARLVSDMLTAVTGPGGTATEAAIDGYLVAGKTGTAQKADYVGGGYARDRWVASFVGYVPADRPRLVISVVIDEPVIAHYGGVVAGPVFRRVGEQALRHLGVPASTGGEALAEHGREQARRRRIARRVEREQARGQGRRTEATPAITPAIDTAEGEAAVPMLIGRTARTALVALAEVGLLASFEGNGLVTEQLPSPGSVMPRGESVHLVLRPAIAAADVTAAPVLASADASSAVTAPEVAP